MAKKKIWLGMTAALLLAFGSVLVSCGSSCIGDGECTTEKAARGDWCTSADCAVTDDVKKAPAARTNPACNC